MPTSDSHTPKRQHLLMFHKEFDEHSDILFPYRSPSHRPHPDPTQHPRNGPGTDPKRSQTEPNGAERSQTEPKWAEIIGWAGRGGLSGGGGVGVVREKEYH